MALKSHYKLLIVGGGTAGIDIAARMVRHLGDGHIGLVEPSANHYYQPLWTLVGGGEATAEQSRHDEEGMIPKGVEWIRDYADRLDPDKSQVVLRGSATISYDYLILAPGLRIDWSAIEGLEAALDNDPRVCSNYSPKWAEKTWSAVRAFKGGTAIFTHPAGAIKCGGAPQKAMYLSEDYWRRHGVREKADIKGYFAMGSIFAIKEFRESLEKVVERKRLDMHFRWDLVKIDHELSQATFKNLDTEEVETIGYDFLHAVPKMFPPIFVAESPLAHQDGPTKGWANVDAFTLQSVSYPNVFACGDVAALPTSKTGAAVRKQAVVVEQNLMSLIKGKPLEKKYNGYTSCPVVTGYGSLVMAEFGYDDKLLPSFPLLDPTKERWSMYMLKKHGLPILYWHLMMKGRA